jgi:hypothetical protein
MSIELERRKTMARKRLAAEQIVTKLRQIEVLQGQGKTIAMACKEAGTTEQNYLSLAEGVWRAWGGPGQAPEAA